MSWTVNKPLRLIFFYLQSVLKLATIYIDVFLHQSFFIVITFLLYVCSIRMTPKCVTVYTNWTSSSSTLRSIVPKSASFSLTSLPQSGSPAGPSALHYREALRRGRLVTFHFACLIGVLKQYTSLPGFGLT